MVQYYDLRVHTTDLVKIKVKMCRSKEEKEKGLGGGGRNGQRTFKIMYFSEWVGYRV